MINCEKAGELTSKKIDRKLSFMERVSLKFHTLMCSTCALFEDEVIAISESIHKENTKHNHNMCSKRKEDLEKLIIEKN